MMAAEGFANWKGAEGGAISDTVGSSWAEQGQKGEVLPGTAHYF